MGAAAVLLVNGHTISVLADTGSEQTCACNSTEWCERSLLTGKLQQQQNINALLSCKPTPALISCFPTRNGASRVLRLLSAELGCMSVLPIQTSCMLVLHACQSIATHVTTNRCCNKKSELGILVFRECTSWLGFFFHQGQLLTKLWWVILRQPVGTAACTLLNSL